MPLLAVERAIDDIARIGEGRGKLAIEIGIVLDHEETQEQVLRSAGFDHPAAAGIDGRPRHFAIARQHCQHIDEAIRPTA